VLVEELVYRLDLAADGGVVDDVCRVRAVAKNVSISRLTVEVFVSGPRGRQKT
jgi:hypothetical protein